jgi:murein tripeptide amidase MpaA
MNSTCFGLYLRHTQACQYKEHTQEDTTERYSIFPYVFFVMTCLSMAQVQAETCSLDVKEI